jgi:DNA topoisomerase I
MRWRSNQKNRVPKGLDGARSARVAGLRYVDDRTVPGIRRVGRRPPFRYLSPDNKPIRDRRELERIRAIVIPPAWTDVWICPHADGHLQATGRDVRGRKQHRYHTRWREVRDEVKYGRLVAFAEALPRIRERTELDLRRPGLPRARVLATIVRLLETTFIRIGNEEYARDNGSIGLTTMRDAHAKVSGARVRFEFRGKSRIRHAVDLNDRRLVRIIKACRDLPGQELFQYLDQNGVRHAIDSTQVNAYIREASGEEFTAKDFRTWSGSVLAARVLAGMPSFESVAEAKRNVVKAVCGVAEQLRNTKAVCRKSYIHPAILDAYFNGQTIEPRPVRSMKRHALNAEELAVVRLLLEQESRLRRKTA